MKGLISGLVRTISHVVRPRIVTRKYPYEKRALPARPRFVVIMITPAEAFDP